MLGFYYHIPVRRCGERLATAGYLGCFLDALARQVDELVLFMHEAEMDDPNMDYQLAAENVRWVSLGEGAHPLRRTFLGRNLVGRAADQLGACDVLLVRAPTHLLDSWARLCGRLKKRLVPLIVGDFRAGNASLKFGFPKRQVVAFLNRVVDARERASLRQRMVVVNSRALAEKYAGIAGEVHEVRTTTLTEDSFFDRGDTCQQARIQLLYTGRFEWAKGLGELLDAFCLLAKERGGDAVLNLVGWQGSRGASVEEAIVRRAAGEGLSDRVVFHGKKCVGEELDAMYRMADVFVMPSITQAEGFPRTIWEAMANSLPVVATTVGAVGSYLEPDQHAVLVSPGDVSGLVAGVRRVIAEPDLRRRLIAGGRELALSNTLDKQSSKLIRLLSR